MLKTKIRNQLDALEYAYKKMGVRDMNRLLKECLEVIDNGKKIVVSALGKNVPICEKFAGTLTSLGIRNNFLHTNSAVHGDLGMVEDGDLVILLSKSGNTEETIYLSKLLKKRKSDTWLLTCNKDSSTSKLVKNTLCLDLKHEGDKWNLVPNNSTVLFMVFLQALAMSIADKMDVDLKTFKANHPGGSIGRVLAKQNV